MPTTSKRTRFRAASRWAVLTLLITSLVTCQRPIEELPSQSIHYLLAWDLSQIHLGSGETKFRWMTDQGFHLEIEAFYLSDFTVQLLPCVDPDEEESDQASMPALGVGVAHAGHGDVLGPAAIREPIAEFVGWTPIAVDPIEVGVDTYCKLHYLVARQPTPNSLPAGLDQQTSLYVRGLITDLATGQKEAFEVHSKLAHGKLVELSVPVGTVSKKKPETDVQPIEVTVQRSMVGTFAGLGLKDFKSRRLDRQLLRNLMNETTFRVVQKGS